MSNPSKARGTAAETALVKWLRDNGFPHADRKPLYGNRDQGDIAVTAGFIIEAKVNAKAGTGQPPHGLLTAWMEQTEAERQNAGADLAVLVVKRAGTAYCGAWFAYLTAGQFAALVGSHLYYGAAPVMMRLADLVPLIRAAGWGTPMEGVA